MPHIGIKMLKGRTQEQKENLSAALVKTLTEQLGCSQQYLTCSIEFYTAVVCHKFFKYEVTYKQYKLYKRPGYNPEDLL